MAGDALRPIRRCGRWALIIAVTRLSGCLEHRELPEQRASACSGCHGDPARTVTSADPAAGILLRAAPPFDVQGHSATSARKVGAHEVHITATATHAAMTCDRCHAGVDSSLTTNSVDQYYYEASHVDGVTKLFGDGFVAINGTTPVFDDAELTCTGSWCHGPSSPSTSVSPPWNQASGGLGCTGCHGTPPPAPHPSVTGACNGCHTNLTNSMDFIDVTRHINGTVDF